MLFLFCALTLAPLSSSLSATAVMSFDLAAMCSAVSPSLRSEVRFTSAELSRRKREANSSAAMEKRLNRSKLWCL